MKLSKSERQTAYIIMLAEYNHSEHYYGLCSMFKNTCGISLDNDGRYGNLREMFPELWEKRKSGANWDTVYLFKDDNHRVEALQQCIKETYNF